MYYICYKSFLSSGANDEDVRNIVSASQKNNLNLQITGMLLFIDNNFIQIIEGDEKVVQKLYKRIVSDPRHIGVKKISEGNTTDRFFNNWIMGFRSITTQDLEEVAEMNKIPGLSIQNILDENKPHYAIELLKSFYSNGELNFYLFWKGK